MQLRQDIVCDVLGDKDERTYTRNRSSAVAPVPATGQPRSQSDSQHPHAYPAAPPRLRIQRHVSACHPAFPL